MNKENWIAVFKSVGLSEETMTRWHQAFETQYPEGHQSFLEWLNIPEDEIKTIRTS